MEEPYSVFSFFTVNLVILFWPKATELIDVTLVGIVTLCIRLSLNAYEPIVFTFVPIVSPAI